jgi:cytochrome d ubiquinol oxidase subunit II
MMATYVVLDGFDFGAGIIHLLVAKKEEERRTVLAAIGPLWDGNEVWLLAGGGVLFFAFPRAYAAGFSGFYMPLMMVLWLLIMRGVSIEFRSLEPSNLWRSFWDGVFFVSSALMAIVLGAALGNVIRGVPLGPDGYFSGPLFTDFKLGPNPGVLDWYTILAGVFTLAVLALHGALFLRMKAEGDVRERSSAMASKLWWIVLLLGLAATVATTQVQPGLFSALATRPWSWILVAGIVVSVIAIPVTLRRDGEGSPFLASCGFIASMLAATAAGLYPTLLRSTLDPASSLTIENAAAGALNLRVGLGWWIIAILLAIIYFVNLFRSFRGKVSLGSGYGH